MDAIVSFLESLIEFILILLSGIFWFVVNLPEYVTILSDLVYYVPGFLAEFVLLSVAAISLFAIIRLL